MSKEIIQKVGVQDSLTFEFGAKVVADNQTVLLGFREVEDGLGGIPLQLITLLMFLHSPTVGDEGVGRAVDEVFNRNDLRLPLEEFFNLRKLRVAT